jgi:hypothetical protein
MALRQGGQPLLRLARQAWRSRKVQRQQAVVVAPCRAGLLLQRAAVAWTMMLAVTGSSSLVAHQRWRPVGLLVVVVDGELLVAPAVALEVEVAVAPAAGVAACWVRAWVVRQKAAAPWAPWALPVPHLVAVVGRCPPGRTVCSQQRPPKQSRRLFLQVRQAAATQATGRPEKCPCAGWAMGNGQCGHTQHTRAHVPATTVTHMLL